MKYYFPVTILFFFILTSCNNSEVDTKKKKTVPDNTAANTAEGASILQLDERLAGTDSLSILFYKDPNSPDSLRYTRYYTQYNSNDGVLIQQLNYHLTGAVTKLERKKNCRSQGKIWLYKNGAVFQTLYFSAQDASCSFIYIIKNGWFYYSSINDGLVKKLAALKPMARELLNKGE